MDTFIWELKGEAKSRGLRDIPQHIAHHVLSVEDVLHSLERSENPLKPDEPTTCIIWPHHSPQREHSGSGQITDIPQAVLKQLDAHIQHVSPTLIPVVILLRASGWSISDVLSLQIDRCLEQANNPCSLVGDIMKTRVLGQTIPLTKEGASVIVAHIAWVKQHDTEEENPKQWLFPASKRHRTSSRFRSGDPLDGTSISKELNRRANTQHITDDQDCILHFRRHAFRQTKGIELVNNGMSLTLGQQWMAQASPDMTSMSAKVLDETMRTQWEKTLQHGSVHFTTGRPEYVAGKKMLTVLNEQQTFDPERVRDDRTTMKLPVGNGVTPPKLLCTLTELPCFHCPASVLTPEDLPALEAYEQQVRERLEIGKHATNA